MRHPAVGAVQLRGEHLLIQEGMMRLHGRDGEVEVDADMVVALKSKWRTRNVEAELAKMHLYLVRYPTRRPKLIWRFVDNWLKKAPATVRPLTLVDAWWATDERTIQQGHALGLSARAGESMQQFRDRISAAVRAAA